MFNSIFELLKQDMLQTGTFDPSWCILPSNVDKREL